MKIRKININNFGLLSKRSINLQGGINVIYFENKQTKTIVQNFIVCFLYGMDNERKFYRSLFRRKYSPFSMEKTKGELLIEKNNVEYLIERSFGVSKSQDTCNVTRVLDGGEIFDLDLDQPGKMFLGMGFEAFQRTMLVKSIDDFINFNKNTKIMNDIAKIKENFDRRFSFDNSVMLINNAKIIIKDIKVSENLSELYDKYLKMNLELDKANEIVHLDSFNKNKLRDLKKRRDHLLNEYSISDTNKKYFKYVSLKTFLSNVSDLEGEINRLEQDLENINEDMPKLNGKNVDKEFIENLSNRIENYKICKKDILKINKLNLSEESKIFDRFEYLNKELDKYSIVKSKLLFYVDKIKKIDSLNDEIKNIKGNGRLSYLFKDSLSRSKKNKQNQNYNKMYLFIVIFAIVMAIIAPTFFINVNGIILMSLTSFILISVVYLYGVFRNYKKIENKDMNSEAGKFYDLKNQISKLERELYPYTYYKIKKDVENIKRIEEELDTLSFRFKDGDLSYINDLNEFREKEKELSDILKQFGFDDIFIQDVENFIENVEFKLNHKKGIEEDLKIKNQEILKLLDGRNKYDLINELETYEKYSNVKVNKSFEEVTNEYDILELEIKNIDEEIINLNKGLENVENNKYKVEIIKDEIINLKNTISYLESRISNVDIYLNKISDIYYEFKESLSPEISMRIDYVIKYLTMGYSTRSNINREIYDDGNVLLKEKIGIEFLNPGMWDLIYFALRITIADLIYEDKGEVPLILDDLFISYDSERMKRALMLLERYSKDRQVILFASSKREAEYLKGNAYVIGI